MEDALREIVELIEGESGLSEDQTISAIHLIGLRRLTKLCDHDAVIGASTELRDYLELAVHDDPPMTVREMFDSSEWVGFIATLDDLNRTAKPQG